MIAGLSGGGYGYRSSDVPAWFNGKCFASRSCSTAPIRGPWRSTSTSGLSWDGRNPVTVSRIACAFRRSAVRAVAACPAASLARVTTKTAHSIPIASAEANFSSSVKLRKRGTYHDARIHRRDDTVSVSGILLRRGRISIRRRQLSHARLLERDREFSYQGSTCRVSSNLLGGWRRGGNSLHRRICWNGRSLVRSRSRGSDKCM